MQTRLENKPELLDQIIPEFSPNCRRLTPGPGYLEALTQDNVSLISTRIKRFTEDGIVTEDDVSRPVDAVICSTGFTNGIPPPFPIVAHGVPLGTAWTPNPITYMGVATPSFPNLLFVGGPNANGFSGTVPQQAETQVTYISKLLRKVSQQRLKSFVISQGAVDDWIEYSDAFFAKTVFSEECSSWANGGNPGGKIHGFWPGSGSHSTFVRRDPRWEDWEWSTRNVSGNRFGYLGNGWTEKEKNEDADVTPYLKRAGEVELKSYHEEWWEVV